MNEWQKRRENGRSVFKRNANACGNVQGHAWLLPIPCNVVTQQRDKNRRVGSLPRQCTTVFGKKKRFDKESSLGGDVWVVLVENHPANCYVCLLAFL